MILSVPCDKWPSHYILLEEAFTKVDRTLLLKRGKKGTGHALGKRVRQGPQDYQGKLRRPSFVTRDTQNHKRTLDFMGTKVELYNKSLVDSSIAVSIIIFW